MDKIGKNIKKSNISNPSVNISKKTGNLTVSDTSFIETLINTIPSPIYYKDINGYFINCNSAFENLVHEKKADIIGKKTASLTANPFFNNLDAIENKIFDNADNKNINSSFTDKNGRIKHILINVSIYYNSHKIKLGSIGSIHDISEHKFIEKALRDSEERYKFLIESTLVAIIVHVKGKITYSNAEGIKLLGARSIDELIGKDITDFIHKDYLESFTDLVLNKASNDRNVHEQKIIRLDNKTIYIEVRSFPFLYRGDPSAQIIAYDITERKNAEEKLKENEEKIRNSLKEKEVMLQEIHHRVKNNLQTISALISLQSFEIYNQDINIQLNEIVNRINSMSLVHQKLYQSNNFAQINFNDYIKTLTEDIFESFAVKQNEIKTIFDIKDIRLNIDTAIPCGLIINEIITNALKYAFKDPVIADPKIGIILNNEDEIFILTIYDNGKGFPADHDFNKLQKLGTKLIDMLTKQLHGTIEVINKNGVKYIIKFREINKTEDIN